MRYLTDHVTNEENGRIAIAATDQPGSGGAYHRYQIWGYDATLNPSTAHVDSFEETVLLFQNGPIPTSGVNGITHEVLLAVLIDRLKSFQEGRYACEDNEVALGLLKLALGVLKHRTMRRIGAGIEGTMLLDPVTGGAAGS